MRLVRLNLLGAGARVSDFDRAREQERARSLPPALPFDPTTLTTMQQAALINLTVTHVKNAVVRALLADAQDVPGGADYGALRELGLAEFIPGKRLHQLTAQGRTAARDLEEALCKRFDIHLMLGPMGGGFTVFYSCSCGWRESFRNSHTAPGNARASWNRHHRTQAGLSKLVVALQPPQRMEG